jgi:hypothetical protein
MRWIAGGSAQEVSVLSYNDSFLAFRETQCERRPALPKVTHQQLWLRRFHDAEAHRQQR